VCPPARPPQPKGRRVMESFLVLFAPGEERLLVVVLVVLLIGAIFSSDKGGENGIQSR